MSDDRSRPEPIEPVQSAEHPNGQSDTATHTPKRAAFASVRACVIVGILAVVADVAILRAVGRPWGASITGGLFVGVFTGYGLWLVTKTRRAVRPVEESPVDRDPSLPPPAGGWANPSGGQKAMGFVGRILDALMPRRRRR